MTLTRLLAAGLLAIPALLAHVPSAEAKVGLTQKGIASYYHDKLRGRKTASGERYDSRAYTAAHKRLPLGTKVRVTNLETGKSILVRINDRGPFAAGRIIDLSRRAAGDLGILKVGLAPVRVEVVNLPSPGSA